MNSGNFFAELKRRNVYKVAVAYAVVSWLLIQIATQVFPSKGAQHSLLRPSLTENQISGNLAFYENNP